MGLFSRKMKKEDSDLLMFALTVSITNLKILHKKEVITSKEYDELSKKTVLTLTKVAEKKGDVNDLIMALQVDEDN